MRSLTAILPLTLLPALALAQGSNTASFDGDSLDGWAFQQTITSSEAATYAIGFDASQGYPTPPSLIVQGDYDPLDGFAREFGIVQAFPVDGTQLNATLAFRSVATVAASNVSVVEVFDPATGERLLDGYLEDGTTTDTGWNSVVVPPVDVTGRARVGIYLFLIDSTPTDDGQQLWLDNITVAFAGTAAPPDGGMGLLPPDGGVTLPGDGGSSISPLPRAPVQGGTVPAPRAAVGCGFGGGALAAAGFLAALVARRRRCRAWMRVQ